MDRQIVYPGAIPLDTDLLNVQRNAMIAHGFLAQAVFGTGTIADGLACTPTVPASMQVSVAPGCIIQNSVVDQNAFGSLLADTTDALVKVGVNLTTTTLTITAPGTAGQSQCYLIEAALSETDTGSTVLSYYNASNPAIPYSGPSNSGAAQYTKRAQTVNLRLVAGTPAATGSQTVPAVDAGYVGLWVVTVANGQSTVIAANIAQYATAPFVLTKLPQLRRRLTGNLTLYVNGSTGNDSNNGLSPTAAFLTLQGAANYIVSGLDLQGYTVTISVADGTYAGVTVRGNPVGSLGAGSIAFVGDTTTPDSCIVNAVNASCFVAGAGAQFSVAGFKVTATGTAGSQGVGVGAGGAGSLINVAGNMDFASCATGAIESNNGGEVTVSANVSFSGASAHGVVSYQGGTVYFNPVTVTLTGTPAFSAGFASVDGPSAIAFTLGVAFSGGATGARYACTNGGYISTQTGNVSFLPGSTAGSSTTGYYT